MKALVEDVGLQMFIIFFNVCLFCVIYEKAVCVSILHRTWWLYETAFLCGAKHSNYRLSLDQKRAALDFWRRCLCCSSPFAGVNA